jgi:coatomer subunit beta'
MYLLGYIPTHNRVYLVDKDAKVYGYSLSLNLIEYQTAVLRGDMEAAEEILPTVPKEQQNKVARFLEARGLPSKSNGINRIFDHVSVSRSERTRSQSDQRPGPQV